MALRMYCKTTYPIAIKEGKFLVIIAMPFEVLKSLHSGDSHLEVDVEIPTKKSRKAQSPSNPSKVPSETNLPLS